MRKNSPHFVDLPELKSIPELLDFLEEILKKGLILINDLRKIYANIQDYIGYLEMQNESKDQKLKELGCLATPYSTDGEAICNYDSD